jgi:superfamily I DNA/RNA helicase
MIEDFPFFRTIHSLATVLGGLKGRRLMESKDILTFDKTIFTRPVWTEKGKAESIKYRDEHPCLSLKSLVSARKSTVEEEIKHVDDKVLYQYLLLSFKENNWTIGSNMSTIGLAEEWIRKYEEYKDRNFFVDYDDVIKNMLQPGYNKANMRFKLFIIDEAQDCSDFMWDFLKLVIDESKETVVCGDDDQAIMDEFGSNRMAFLNLETTQKDEILKTSYRLPTEIFNNLMSGGAMDGILNADRPRKEKEFTTKKGAKEGFIVRTFKKLFGDKGEEELDLIHLYIEVKNNKDKDWLIMAPTNKTVESISNLFTTYKLSHYCKNEPVLTDNSIILII